MSVITLTTDFGNRDWFVGTMKGVILAINPRARVVDLTHEISPGDIRQGAFALAAASRYFPAGTIHVAVVDPGVGSRRRAIAVKTKRFIFVGPDNGVLSLSLDGEEIRTVRLLENPKLLLREVSHTFHGRDIFAPMAAHLSTGIGFRKVGPRANSYVRLDWPRPLSSGGEVTGQIVHLDHFGNAITNVPATLLPVGADLLVQVNDASPIPLREFYAAVPVGKPVAVAGSTGFVEIAINGGSASASLGLQRGAPVTILQAQ